MKRVFIILAACLCTLAAGAQSLMAGSYNIRYKNSDDSIRGNVWTERCKVICDQINWEQPDIFGTQECYLDQLENLKQRLDGYDYIGAGRDDGKDAGEHSAIFYKTDHFEKLADGNFWLSQTPDRPGMGWDAVCPRICTWGKFRDKRTGFTLFFFNLHMDHIGVTARRESAKLVVSRIKEIAGDAPVILTGDFNVDQTNEIFRIFTGSGVLKDAYDSARLRFAENGTFNDFLPDVKTNSRIDHVMVSPGFEVSNYGVLTNGYWTPLEQSASEEKDGNSPTEIDLQQQVRRVPSDHYPVLVRVAYRK